MLGDLVPPKLPLEFIPSESAVGVDDIIKAVDKGGVSRELVTNPRSPEMAEYILRDGVAVKDKAFKSAIDQGIDPNLVSMIKTSSPATKEKYRGMLEIVKRGKKDLRYQDRFRPWAVAGKSMTERIDFIKKVNSDAGKAVKKEAHALAGQSVDYAPAVDSFISDLDDLGVVLAREGESIKPDFSNSVFRSSPKPKKIINDIVKHLDTENPVDARQVHIAKKYIDELVNWGKGATGNAGQVENVAKSLRRGLNESLGKKFPAYKAANDTYSETINVLDDIVKSSGIKLKPNDAGFDQAVGTGLRRLLSNAQSKSTLTKAADDIEAISKKHGGEFADDVRDQVSFANQMDALFGPAAKTSLAGEMSKASERAADVTLGQKTAFGAGAEVLKEGYKKFRGINEEGAIMALEEILNK